MRYIQVSKALYDYEAQTEEELSIREDDTLYVIEKEDDDWWKAELKQSNSDEQGPVGLVPATYLEKITPIGRVRAEYDYQAQQEEELSFNEDDELDLLETDDPDWYLVQSNKGEIGLVPCNYVSSIGEQAEHQEEQTVTETSIYTPPPVPQVPVTAPPAITAPPTTTPPVLTQRSASTPVNDDAQSWTVNEYDTIKKKKKKDRGNLFVGNGMLCYGSETDKSLPVQQYPILDVVKYLYDGKILHIEIDGVKAAVLDLQASSKSEAKAILAKISDSSRAAQVSNIHVNPYERQIAAPATAIAPRTGSPEPILAIQEPEPTCEPKWGVSLFSFQAEGGDELSVNEQEQIYVVDYERTDGWFRVQKTNGDTGLVPSSYVQFDDDDSAQRKREEEERRAEEKRREEQKRREEEERRRREEEERRRREEEERRRREEEERRRKEEEARQKQIEAERKSQLARSNSRKDLPKPDASKVRTWTDRSGSFRVEAQFIDFHNGKLRLHKLNGVKIDVPVEKMSPEDVRWVEKYGQQTATAPPQKKFNERWDWFDWFMIIGIPMQASLQYASAFKAEKLDDSDIPKLTHRQMKTLGLKEDHVQRVERYIETGTPEYYEDEENKKKQQLQDQIRKDEEYAKQLQKEMEQSKSSPTSNGRPRPTASTPKKEIHPDLLDFIGTQLTSNSDTAKVKEPTKVNNDFVGFNDDAWAPRSTSSPVAAAPAPPPPGPTPEQLAEQEAERKRKEEQDQIRKIQMMGLEKQTMDQKKQLEELQKLTQQQIEIQKQIAMQTGTQQQQQVLQLQAQKQQLEQQQQIAQATGFNSQATGFNSQPTGFSSQPIGFNSQPTGFNSQPTGFNAQPTGFNNQTTGFNSQPTGFNAQSNDMNLPGSNGRPRPSASNNIISNPSLSQWQPNQPQQQQPPPTQQTGFQASSFTPPPQQQQQPAWQGLQPQMTGFPTSMVGNQYQQAPVLQPSIAPNNSIGVQPTGRNWNSATPANPFGSPSISPLQAQMTGVQFSTPSPQAFNQPLQAQMTGFPPQGNNVFTPQGSMQYGQSAFPAQRPW